jgi:hypothetical protein
MMMKWIIAAAVCYGATVALLYVGQRSLQYFPERRRTAPQAVGLPEAEEAVLDIADGERVIVWHVPARENQPIFLYFDGNGGSLRGRGERFRATFFHLDVPEFLAQAAVSDIFGGYRQGVPLVSVRFIIGIRCEVLAASKTTRERTNDSRAYDGSVIGRSARALGRRVRTARPPHRSRSQGHARQGGRRRESG